MFSEAPPGRSTLRPLAAPSLHDLRKLLLMGIVGFFLLSASPVAPVSAASEGRVTARVRIVSISSQLDAQREILRLAEGHVLTTESSWVTRQLIRVDKDPVSSMIVVEWTAN